MDDVSRALGISKKTLYQHIETKGELVHLSVKKHHADEMAIMDEIKSSYSDALEEMVTICQYILQVVKSIKPGVMYDLQKYYGNVWRDWDEKHSAYVHDILVDNLETGIKQGWYRPDIDVEIIARLYVGKTRLVMDEQIFPTSQFKQEQVVRMHFIYHLHGILTRSGIEKLYSEDLLNKKLNV